MREPQKVKALVPMRETSERVPGKNYRQLCGRPLYSWIIDTLMRSDWVDEVIVNTDSETIARGVESQGARVLWRPESLRGRMVNIRPLIGYDLSQVGGDDFLQTHSTNPLLRTETVDRAVQAYFADGPHDCLFTVTSHQARFYYHDGRPVNHDPAVLKRTQDLPPLLEENSCVYLFSRSVYDRFQHRIGERPLFMPMDPLEAVDIDEESDFALAEALMRSRLGDSTSVGAASQ